MEDGAQREENLAPSWPVRTQAYVVASLAAAAALSVFFFYIFPSGSGPDVAPAARMPSLVPTAEQRARLQIQTVGYRVFHTDIVTDGYVAPNGGFALSGARTPLAHSLPVLAGQSSDLLQAESDLVTANAQYRAAEANEKRQHALFESDGAAQKDWQQAQVDLATASAALASARNRLRILGKTDAEMAAMAPAGQNAAVFSVSDISTVWLVANVRETDATLVHLGDESDVMLPAFPDENFRARIAYISSLIDPNTHRLIIGAQIQNADRRLKPNMAASFTIHGGHASDSPAVPQGAVVYNGNVASVWLVGARGALMLRRVTIGRSNSGYSEVTSGLSAGEQIVTSGALFINQATGQD